ncbi:unnamed protein product [Candidula unifasciata]|uniref:sphinganine-1-phosphate aldolase n=1 Tax=Candidula unifasciata TaxID=100452 RepID=A0A8S3Z8B5_9EUPU|nr:unnamed protein product [Candidula unifasciata]
MILLIEHLVVAVVFLVLLGVYLRNGAWETLRTVLVAIKQIPWVAESLESVLKSEATNFIKTTKLASGTGEKPAKIWIPKKGMTREEILAKMKSLKEKETNHMEGRIFAYTYTLADDHFQLQKEVFEMFTEQTGLSPEHDELVKLFQKAFLHENALNPMVYPSLRQMETEIVSMTCSMMNGNPATCGFLTSGGTESILMAVKVYRDRAQKLYPWIKKPEIVCPVTQHPAIAKAAHYFGLTVRYLPVKDDMTADVSAMEQALNSNTVLVACSAPQFCHGVLDPVEEISNMAAKHGLPCHVDACFGGFMLPWVEKLGYPVPKWDFRCPGVTSISADIHKYGYTVKGASVIAYRSDDLRKFQIFSSGSWPGGLYGSPSMAGTRPGGNIAAAWAAINSLGEEGYMSRARQLMDITDQLKAAVTEIEGLKIIGNPVMTCFAIGSSDPDVDILAVADVMEKKGWTMERQQNPSCVHCTILPHHQISCDDLAGDLKESVTIVKGNKQLSKQGTAGMYGMMATIPDTAIVEDFIKEFFSEIYKLQ